MGMNGEWRRVILPNDKGSDVSVRFMKSHRKHLGSTWSYLQ
jgi:hypothetical protein